MINSVAIVGAGNIGFRHFQGIIKSSSPLKIYLVDPKINYNKDEFLNQKNMFHHEIFFYENLMDLPKSLDFLICSTTANIRKKLLLNILDNINIQYILSEKVVFQSSDDFDELILKADKNKTKIWVNCPQRTYELYRSIKENFRGKNFQMSSLGNNWNLASNSIHVLDLFCYLTDDYDIKFIEKNFLSDKIQSKREGYYELKGYAKIANSSGVLIIEDSIKYNYMQKFFIKTNDQQIEIDEINNNVSSSIKELEKKYKFPFQSNLTLEYLKNLNEKNTLNLVNLKNCKKYHIPMLNVFSNKFSEIFEKKIINCPIT
jgi:hypothetical protein